MQNIGSKKQLEVVLSRLSGFSNAKVSEEQYITPSSIAAEVIWKAYFSRDIERKIIVDMGAGTGILGLGALLMGAKKVIFIEKDADSLNIAKTNLEKLKSEGYELKEAEFLMSDIKDISQESLKESINASTVIMNPPFGTKVRHADKEFLEKAFLISEKVYTFHKTSTIDYLVQIGKKRGFDCSENFNFDYLLKGTMSFHTRQKKYIKVSCLIFSKSK